MNISNESWLMLVIGFLLSIIPAYYFYRRSIKEPIACYLVRATNVIDIKNSSGIGEKIAVSYESQVIPRLSVGNVSFWNGGNSTLEGDALTERDPLRINISDGKILEATIITDPNPQCGCGITTDSEGFPNSVLLTFDFLVQHNGFVVRILHTGQGHAMSVTGTVKGVRLEDERGATRNYSLILRFINQLAILIFVIFCFVFIGVALSKQLLGVATSTIGDLATFSFATAAVCFFLSLSSFTLAYLQQRTSHKVPPKLGG